MSPEMLVLAVLGAAGAAVGGLFAWMYGSLLRFRAYYRHKGEEAPPLPLGALLRYVVGEGLALCTVLWWQVRAAGRDGLLVPEGAETGPPVLCVHGFSQNGTNLWGIRRALARRGRASMAVSHGRYRPSLQGHVPPVVAALLTLAERAPDGRVDVVAHSMGGVILRLALTTHPELVPMVRRVVTLGGPHAGTAAARGLPLGPVRALGRRSEVLRGLPCLPNTITLTTIAGRHDLVVYPQATCHLNGGRAIDLPDVGHAGLLTRAGVHALVVDALCADDAPGAAEA